jgi:hypothetical protein
MAMAYRITLVVAVSIGALSLGACGPSSEEVSAVCSATSNIAAAAARARDLGTPESTMRQQAMDTADTELSKPTTQMRMSKASMKLMVDKSLAAVEYGYTHPTTPSIVQDFYNQCVVP